MQAPHHLSMVTVPAATLQCARQEGSRTGCMPVRRGVFRLHTSLEAQGTPLGAGSALPGSGCQPRRKLSRAPRSPRATYTRTQEEKVNSDSMQPSGSKFFLDLQMVDSVWTPQPQHLSQQTQLKYRNIELRGKKCQRLLKDLTHLNRSRMKSNRYFSHPALPPTIKNKILVWF